MNLANLYYLKQYTRQSCPRLGYRREECLWLLLRFMHVTSLVVRLVYDVLCVCVEWTTVENNKLRLTSQ